MICIGNFQKIRIFYVNSTAKPENFVVFAFTYVSGSHMLFYEDFGINSYTVDSDEAVKRANEALNASSLQFFRSIKRFIAFSQRFFT